MPKTIDELKRAHAEKRHADEMNPDFTFRLTYTDLLVKIASGEVSAQQLAYKELRSRGLNASGKFIGFKNKEE